MKKIIFILSVLFFISTACQKEITTPVDLSLYQISYRIESNWTGYAYNATFNQNGELVITEKNELYDNFRKSEQKISSEDMIRIEEKLNEITSIELSDTYGFNKIDAPTDLPITIIKYTAVNKADSTCMYFPAKNDLPKELQSFIQVVKEILSTKDNFTN